MRQNTKKRITSHLRPVRPLERQKSKDTQKIRKLSSRLYKDEKVAKATAEKLGIPFIDPLAVNIEPKAVSLLKPAIATRRQALPIRLVDDTLLVAMAFPEKAISIKSLELLTGLKVLPAAAPRSALSKALKRVYDQRSVASKTNDHCKKVLSRGGKKAVTKKQSSVPTISIISNKGGVGKTHFAINLAYALAERKNKILLVDSDLGSADISNKLSVFPKYHLLDFLQKNRNIEDLVVSTKFNFDFVGGTYGDFKLANLYYAQKVKFIKNFKKISQYYDFALFDLGAGISRTVLDFALGARHTVIVVTPQDLISGYACAKAAFYRFKEIQKRLEERFPKYQAKSTFSPMMMINQVDNLEQGIRLFDLIRKTLNDNINLKEGRFKLQPEYLGAIEYDKKSFRSTEANKKPLLMHAPYVRASQSINHMSKRFLSSQDTYESKPEFGHHFFKRLTASFFSGIWSPLFSRR